MVHRHLMYSFNPRIDIIGINPFVFVPAKILEAIFKDAGKATSPIRVSGTINDQPFSQTLVRYGGEWRLYINTQMLPRSPKRIGERIRIQLAFDSNEKEAALMHPSFAKALNKNKSAKKVFDSLSPSRSAEIVRYIFKLKTPEAIEKNVVKAIDYLLGKGSFVGRKSV